MNLLLYSIGKGWVEGHNRSTRKTTVSLAGEESCKVKHKLLFAFGAQGSDLDVQFSVFEQTKHETSLLLFNSADIRTNPIRYCQPLPLRLPATEHWATESRSTEVESLIVHAVIIGGTTVGLSRHFFEPRALRFNAFHFTRPSRG